MPNWAKIAIGVAAIAVGVAVTAVTGGATLPALVAGVNAAITAGAVSAVTSVATTAVASAINGDNFGTFVKKAGRAAIDGFSNGFMLGGIMAGTSQVLSGGFKVAAKLGAKTGRKGGISIGENVKILSPNHPDFYENGGTIVKIGKNLRVDVGSKTLLHLHIPGIRVHIPIGKAIAGIVGGLV